MAISKVVYKSSSSAQGVTWMDATSATAAASDIIAPKTAMLANGVVTEGTGSGGSSMNVQVDNTNHRVSTTSYSDTGAELTVAVAGTYDIYWSAFRSSTSSGTNGTQWYKNDVAQGSAYTSWSNSYCQSIKVSGVTLAKNDVVTIYARSSNTSRYVCVENLTIVQTA